MKKKEEIKEEKNKNELNENKKEILDNKEENNQKKISTSKISLKTTEKDEKSERKLDFKTTNKRIEELATIYTFNIGKDTRKNEIIRFSNHQIRKKK